MARRILLALLAFQSGLGLGLAYLFALLAFSILIRNLRAFLFLILSRIRLAPEIFPFHFIRTRCFASVCTAARCLTAGATSFTARPDSGLQVGL